jgi:membrane protein implicated in regulation of membrane protease activity
MIVDLVRELGAWSWLIAGVALLALELAAPGVFFIWFGLAAVVVGGLALLIPLPWQAQVILFVILAIAIVLVGRRFFARSAGKAVPTGLNERGRRLIGTIVVLDGPIVDGRGRVRMDDTTWRVTGPDMPAGTSVRIVGTDGALLSVKPVEAGA